MRRGSKLDLAVGLDLLAGLQHALHDGLGIAALGKLNDHFLRHEIHNGVRDAYKLTGCMVSDCISKDKTLEELTLDEFKGYSALFENDIYDAIDLIKCCEGRTSYGGPSEASVKKQIELASAQLGAWEAANA